MRQQAPVARVDWSVKCSNDGSASCRYSWLLWNLLGRLAAYRPGFGATVRTCIACRLLPCNFVSYSRNRVVPFPYCISHHELPLFISNPSIIIWYILHKKSFTFNTHKWDLEFQWIWRSLYSKKLETLKYWRQFSEHSCAMNHIWFKFRGKKLINKVKNFWFVKCSFSAFFCTKNYVKSFKTHENMFSWK